MIAKLALIDVRGWLATHCLDDSVLLYVQRLHDVPDTSAQPFRYIQKSPLLYSIRLADMIVPTV